MKTTKRLEKALIKLYNAYHNNRLNPEDCKACAVGNILDNFDSWKYLSDKHGSLQLSYVGRVHQNLGRKFNGYTPKELLQIEKVFLDACGFKTRLRTCELKYFDQPITLDCSEDCKLQPPEELCEMAFIGYSSAV